MSEEASNPPAFPRPHGVHHCGQEVIDHPEQGGMSLRDYFAGQALAGILAAYSGTQECLPTDAKAAGWAYEYADAMLAERKED